MSEYESWTVEDLVAETKRLHSVKKGYKAGPLNEVREALKSKQVRPTNHGFTGTEQSDYDSLKARGRTAYDHSRWYYGTSHDTAFVAAKEAHGLKSDQAGMTWSEIVAQSKEA